MPLSKPRDRIAAASEVRFALAAPDNGGITPVKALLSFMGERGVLMAEIPSWRITGDWFDNCSCAVACPCTFAQAPDNGFCETVLFWHIGHGHYGDINLDGLSFVRVGLGGEGQGRGRHLH